MAYYFGYSEREEKSAFLYSAQKGESSLLTL